ncbi:MAG TPA: mechanosensitive ion channel [Candidatus Anaerobutyricum stercoris]|uniref:Mechanosensitive ion channel n=1 Tax=Candidatus Anaerobutyricum stercoris TaxID=2838457 RepID=A0A9D2J8N1_9FIRM|nr:mechanosensitive ion channel domain-containing protein [Eubacterium sp. An3]OUO28561.1 mechanosensitive ion channel protein [Eubacterium sp. An3]CVI73046.1 Small-conductance mechanosensitive channel [Eubacteriaceae bacterium CHKCI004]HIZ40553.1 mechanosensitive ion channel [Candidatus Anaerobutyricum stercoris]
MALDLDSVRKSILSVVYEYLGRTGVLFMEFLGNCVIALLILIIGLKLSNYVVKLCKRVFERSKMDLMIQTFLLSCMRIGLKILVVFIAVQQVGVQASSIIAVIGSAGLAVGLSLQGSLSNIAGGVILLVVKPFQVGDYILEESSGKEGTVQSIGIMYTKLSSMDNKAILIPNGNLSNASITNVTNQDKRRVDLLVGIEYSEDIKKVKEILSEVIESEPVLLKEDPVKVYVSDFRESCIDIGIRYWVRTEDYWESRWRVLEKIKYAFDEAGVTIPFNQIDVNVISHQ